MNVDSRRRLESRARSLKSASFPAAVLLLLSAWTARANPGWQEADYYQQVDNWRQKRLESLTADDGWLTLIGLFWLENGANPIGSDPTNRIILPAGKAPARLGVVTLEGGALRFEAAEGAEVLHAGQPVRIMVLEPDSSDEPTTLDTGDLSLFVIERSGRFALRVRDRAHPARTSFNGIDHYPVDPVWRIAARFEPYEPPKSIPVPNVLGTVEEEPSPGAVLFEIDGKKLRLDALLGSGGRLFLLFADRTSGRETYGGGRFLYTEAPASDGTVSIDFNLAYNPPCAFTDFATCPLPPRQNRLPVAIRAGELTFDRPH